MLIAAFPLAVGDTLSMIRGFIYTMRENKRRKQNKSSEFIKFFVEIKVFDK